MNDILISVIFSSQQDSFFIKSIFLEVFWLMISTCRPEAYRKSAEASMLFSLPSRLAYFSTLHHNVTGYPWTLRGHVSCHRWPGVGCMCMALPVVHGSSVRSDWWPHSEMLLFRLHLEVAESFFVVMVSHGKNMNNIMFLWITDGNLSWFFELSLIYSRYKN